MTAPSENLLPFIRRQLTDAQLPLSFRPPFATWQREVRDVWRKSLPPHSPAIVQSKAGNVIRLAYPTGDCGEAYFRHPDTSGLHPAIVLMHDHGGEFTLGWRKMVRTDESGAFIDRLYDGRALADWLVQQGFAVLVTDALGWGSRFAGGYDQQQALAAQAMQCGWSLAGIVAADDLAALAWLSTRPEVDPQRIGVMGFSFGGFRAWQLAALAPSIRAAAAVGWMGMRSELLADNGTLLRGQSAFYTLHPSMAGLIDYPDMAALVTDRALFIATANQDKHFPLSAALPAFDRIKRIQHAAHGAVETAIYDGGHTFPIHVQERALAFLQSQLQSQ